MNAYELLPEHLRAGMQRYIEHGIEPGSFLRAAIENDFVAAVPRADPITRAALYEIASFIALMPSEAWGSPAKVQAWIDAGKARRADQTLAQGGRLADAAGKDEDVS